MSYKTITLDESSDSIKYLSRVDKRLAKAIRSIGDISYTPHEDAYDFLIHEVLEQMLSTKVARKMHERLSLLCNGHISPEAIDCLTDEQIRSIGTSRTKVATIRELTNSIITGKICLDKLKNLSDGEVTELLCSVKGIGSWTAKMYLIFVLDRPDVLPFEDYAFLQGYKWLYKTEDVSRKTVERRCKKWKPYSSIASRYMYKALDLGFTKNELIYDHDYLKIIHQYLSAGDSGYAFHYNEEVKKRAAGKQYSINDHIKGMVYAMLSSQTRWHRIESHLTEIDTLFNDYDPDSILATPPEAFSKKLYAIKCGNISTKAQMEALPDNIRTLLAIQEEYGSIDAFITSEPADLIVERMARSSSPFKLKMLGEALVWEYLRNVGIDGAKPDIHLRRFFGSDRMGGGNHSPATVKEVNEQITILANETGMSKTKIDNLIWNFCADGRGEMCTANPQCTKCPIRAWCNS